MEEKTTVSVPAEKIKLNVEDVLNNYSLEELKASACENFLIGNFDKDKKYKILDIIYPELINLKKIIKTNTNDSYTAYAIVNNLKLNFEVNFRATDDGKMTATLVLKEKFVTSGIYETTLSTPLQTLTGDNNVEFLCEVRKTFHLFSDEEDDQMDLLQSYVSPPIELASELLRKTEMFDAFKELWKDMDKEYINNLFNILKKSKEGREIIKKFLKTVKDYDFSTLKQEKNHIMKTIFDKIIDDEIKNKAIEKTEFVEIVVLRQGYTEKIETGLKQKLKEQIAMLKPETIKPVEKPKIEVKTQAKSAPSKTSAPAKSAESSPKPASSSKQEDSSTKKVEKKTPFVGVAVPKLEVKKQLPNTPHEIKEIAPKNEVLEQIDLNKVLVDLSLFKQGELNNGNVERSKGIEQGENIANNNAKRAQTASQHEQESGLNL